MESNISALAPAQCHLEVVTLLSRSLFMKWRWMEAAWTNNLFDAFPIMAFGAKLPPWVMKIRCQGLFGSPP